MQAFFPHFFEYVVVSHARHVSGMRVGGGGGRRGCAVAGAHHLNWTREGDDGRGRADGLTGLMGLIYNLCTPKRLFVPSLWQSDGIYTGPLNE